jgi:hypothetical protein
MTHRFYLVDVFAERPYSGNQLAVVVGEQDVPEETMQLLAAEMNYSETTFVKSAPEIDGDFRVRIFTPAREIAFAGHPILGTAAVLRQHLALDSSEPLTLNLAVGQVRVTFEHSADGREVAWFVAPPVSLGPICVRGSSSRRMACVKTRPPGMARPSSARISWSIGSCPNLVSPCGSNKAMRFAGRRWSCCAPEWSTSVAR